MKNVILFFSSLVFVFGLISCNSNESKAKNLAETKLKSSLKDPSSLEIREWGKLDSSFVMFTMTKEYEEMEAERSKYVEKAYSENYSENMAKADSIEAEVNKKMDTYKGEWQGWQIRIKYTAKNSFNANVPGLVIYTFDKELTKVINEYYY